MQELLKVPDSVIIKDLLKCLKNKKIELGMYKSYVQEKNHYIKSLLHKINNMKKHINTLQKKIDRLEQCNHTTIFPNKICIKCGEETK